MPELTHIDVMATARPRQSAAERCPRGGGKPRGGSAAAAPRAGLRAVDHRQPGQSLVPRWALCNRLASSVSPRAPVLLGFAGPKRGAFLHVEEWSMQERHGSGPRAMQATARAQSSANPRLRLNVPRTPRGGFSRWSPHPLRHGVASRSRGFRYRPPVSPSMARAGGMHRAGIEDQGSVQVAGSRRGPRASAATTSISSSGSTGFGM
jgi:hypothetical protein